MLSACSTTCRNWVYDNSVPGLGRLYYPTQDCFSGIKVEIQRICGTTFVYLDIYSFQFPDDHTPVTIQINNHSYVFDASRLEGYQRLLLPQEGSDLLIDALYSGNTVWIQVGSFKQNVDSNYFIKYFNRLQRKN